jgi:hypothetical protein
MYTLGGKPVVSSGMLLTDVRLNIALAAPGNSLPYYRRPSEVSMVKYSSFEERFCLVSDLDSEVNSNSSLSFEDCAASLSRVYPSRRPLSL